MVAYWLASSQDHTPIYSVNVVLETINLQKTQNLRLHFEATREKTINSSINQPVKQSALQNPNLFSIIGKRIRSNKLKTTALKVSFEATTNKERTP